ncbi:MAG: type I pullulanase [Oscillospiraceae bacterium]|nr:type I pullulanase [Oscillospiraceae bacterium]
MASNRRHYRRFDGKYCYNGKDLGASYSAWRTVFKLWSPEADQVNLSLYRDDASPAYAVHSLVCGDRGVWSLAIEGDLHGIYYDYEVEAAGLVRCTGDPYAAACGRNGARSMVVDLSRTNPAGFELDVSPPLQSEQVIYELHVKDFSWDPDSGVPAQYRGTFKAFSWTGPDGKLPLCMAHIKELGVTHVQLLPIFDFGSVDEGGDSGQFNWGYDPANYNVPEGSYATDPSDGALRIRECKEMVQALHKNGLRVVMDVVYNHTYAADSWLERSAPDYYYRQRRDGSLSNGSGCGNDVAAGRAMVDNYIANSVMYWAREYHIDGFRFDLMGLLTVELMNRIQRELDQVFGPGEKLLYGEPWRADDSPMEPDTHPALKSNVALLDSAIGVFCDSTRDAIKGSCFLRCAPGFVNGGTGLEEDILQSVTGWPRGAWEFEPHGCSQIINYVSCHDNLTLWDKLVLCAGQNDYPDSACFAQPQDELLRQNKLAAFIYFTCLGRPFLQAGEEFGRTKLGDGNSYRSPPEINMLRWEQAARFAPLTDYYRQLIRLRKALPGLCRKSPDAADYVTDQTVLAPQVVSFRISQGGRAGEPLWVIYNASPWEYVIHLPDEGWVIRADGQCAWQSTPVEGWSLSVPAQSGMLLAQTPPT